MVYETVAGTVQEFIDYSLIVVTLMIIYFIFKLFTIDGPTKEDKKRMDEERINAGRDWVKDKWGKYKESEANKAEAVKNNAEKAKRARVLGGAKGFAIEIEKECDEIADFLKTQSDSSLHKAKNEIKKIEKHFNDIKKIIRAAKHGTNGTIRTDLGRLSDFVEAVEQNVENDVKDKLPKDEKSTNWRTEVNTVRTGLAKIKGYTGHLMNSIDEFVDNEKVVIPAHP